MTATNYLSRVRKSSTRWVRAQSPATLAAGVLLLVGAVAFMLVAGRTWSRLEHLQKELAAMQTESYLLGVRLSGLLEQLNGTLLRFQLSKSDPEQRARWTAQSRRFSELLTLGKAIVGTPGERELLQQIETAFDTYQREAGPLLEKSVRAVRRDSAAEISAQIDALADPVSELCEQLVKEQNAAWKAFRASSNSALEILWRSAAIALILLVALALMALFLAHRVAVAPLRLELGETRSALERQEKLASLGTLAAGVAHEIRNPLASLKFQLFNVKQMLPEDFGGHEDIAVIDDEINRLEHIIRDFLMFARPAEPTMAEVSAQQVLQTVHDLLKASLEARGIRTVFEPGEPVWLRADRHQLEQVLINLVQNAADSIEGSGAVTLRVRQGAARLGGKSQPAAILEVADTGAGIPPDVQKRLFDPFFSTKAGGTGLGLSISERIVEMHGGVIQYQTQVKRGTVFQVVLPHTTPTHVSPNSPH